MILCLDSTTKIGGIFIMKKDIDKTELEKLYNEDEYSTRDLAKHFNVSQSFIRSRMKDFGIQARTSKDGKNTKRYKEKIKALGKKYKEEYTTKSIESGHRLVKICPTCGKEFTTIKSKDLKYCCKECADKAKEKVNTCDRCGKVLDNKWAKYCPDCLKQVKHDNNYNRVETKCAYCGKPLSVIPSRFNSNEYCYCDSTCMAKDYERRFSGENSPTWKGGKRHYKGGWLKARDKARERDNYTCQRCGLTEDEQGSQMDVHHIRNYRLFSDKTEANKLDNLVCLCHKCHSFIHSNSNIDKLYLNNDDEKDTSENSNENKKEESNENLNSDSTNTDNKNEDIV